jgi:hypothetical protein
MAVAVGAVGCSLLTLSVWHCTEAIGMLTGSPVMLAGLLAIGIDCGLVACELASIVADGDKHTRQWAGAYVWAAVALSAVLNAVASGAHAERYAVLAYAVGALIPCLVLVLGKVAGLLWERA